MISYLGSLTLLIRRNLKVTCLQNKALGACCTLQIGGSFLHLVAVCEATCLPPGRDNSMQPSKPSLMIDSHSDEAIRRIQPE